MLYRVSSCSQPRQMPLHRASHITDPLRLIPPLHVVSSRTAPVSTTRFNPFFQPHSQTRLMTPCTLPFLSCNVTHDSRGAYNSALVRLLLHLHHFLSACLSCHRLLVPFSKLPFFVLIFLCPKTTRNMDNTHVRSALFSKVKPQYLKTEKKKLAIHTISLTPRLDP